MFTQIKFRHLRGLPRAHNSTGELARLRARRTKIVRDFPLSIMGFYATSEARENCTSFDVKSLPTCTEFPTTVRLQAALQDYGANDSPYYFLSDVTLDNQVQAAYANGMHLRKLRVLTERSWFIFDLEIGTTARQTGIIYKPSNVWPTNIISSTFGS